MRPLVPALGTEVARWSGQVLETIDRCGFIGLNPGNKHVWITTGDSGQGMTQGALAGLLLRKQILGEAIDYARQGQLALRGGLRRDLQREPGGPADRE